MDTSERFESCDCPRGLGVKEDPGDGEGFRGVPGELPGNEEGEGIGGSGCESCFGLRGVTTYC